MYEWQHYPIYKKKGLYIRGCIPSLRTPTLAVVGSRHISEYGKQVVWSIIPTIASYGVVIVSGFMYGVDAAAHQAALDGHGITMAVLGSGLNVPCPAYHNKLYGDILIAGGAVISQFAPHERAQRWMFPKRNALVAEICQAVLVIEARCKSGSLITARECRRLGKKVMAIPGPIVSPLSEGTNELIKEGALLVRSATDVLTALGVTPLIESQGQAQLMLDKPSTLDELAQILKMSIPELSAKIGLMVLRGEIFEKEGRYYAR